jgi:hypothetical protein
MIIKLNNKLTIKKEENTLILLVFSKRNFLVKINSEELKINKYITPPKTFIATNERSVVRDESQKGLITKNKISLNKSVKNIEIKIISFSLSFLNLLIEKSRRIFNQMKKVKTIIKMALIKKISFTLYSLKMFTNHIVNTF